MTQAPASIRYNNPGAMWPGQSSKRFGASDYATIGGGNQIAIFSDPVNGAAAQFDLLSRNYTGLPLAEAIRKWSGGNASDAYVANIAKRTGLSPDTVLTPEFFSDAGRSIPLARAMAAHEAGADYPLSDEQWSRAFQMAQGGNGESGMLPAIAMPNVGLLNGQALPMQAPASEVPGVSIAQLPQNAQGGALPAGLLSAMGFGGGDAQPIEAQSGAPGQSFLQRLADGDKASANAMPKMADFQFSAPQRAPVDLSRLAQIAQSRQKLGSQA